MSADTVVANGGRTSNRSGSGNWVGVGVTGSVQQVPQISYLIFYLRIN